MRQYDTVDKSDLAMHLISLFVESLTHILTTMDTNSSGKSDLAMHLIEPDLPSTRILLLGRNSHSGSSSTWSE